MELFGEVNNRRAYRFRVLEQEVLCDWAVDHPRFGPLSGEAAPVYVAREMKDGEVISAVKGGRFPGTSVVVRGRRAGKPFYVMFPEAEAMTQFLGFLEENGMGSRVEAIREKLEADRVAAAAREEELRRQREQAAAERAAKLAEIRRTGVRAFYRSVVYNDYGPKPVEVFYGVAWFLVEDGGHYFAPIPGSVLLDEENPVLQEALQGEPCKNNAGNGIALWPCTAEQEAAALEAEKVCQAEREKKAAEEAERKAREEAERAERARRELESAMENELAYFDGTPLANITHRLLHSIGARERDGVVAVYETSHCQEFGAPGTYELRAELKALGATWNAREKEWELPCTDENRERTVAFLREHDVKKDPVAMGYSRCWECGVWFRGHKCPCCGEE